MKKHIFLIFLILIITLPTFSEDLTVYITKSGSKYHAESCSSLSSSAIPISLESALSQGYEPCNRCNPPTEVPVRNQQSFTAIAVADKEALALPYTDHPEQIIEHEGYSLLYSEEHEQPYWVAYLLTAEELSGNVNRTDNFRSDNSIQTSSASLSDYRGSGYDRGHLAPAADMEWSTEAMKDSFYLSNMSPQLPGFNRGIWKKLEEWIRDEAVDNSEIYVVTGPVLTDRPYQTIGENEVAVPNYYYKVLLDYTEPDLKAIGFLLPNESSKQPLSDYAVSVDEVEDLTGLDFFYLLDDTVEAQLEGAYEFAVWD